MIVDPFDVRRANLGAALGGGRQAASATSSEEMVYS
jgi:hypothetical protein